MKAQPTIATQYPIRPAVFRAGFTLLELLVVVGIIGILASITIPSLKGLGRANKTAAASRQILDDLAVARLRAISERTTIYMVFLPPNLFNSIDNLQLYSNQERTQINRLLSGQLTSYALIAKRSVGDQPGRETPRYLTEWRPLPDGMLVATNKFIALSKSVWSTLAATNRPFFYFSGLPFPNGESRTDFLLPGIAFNSHGQILQPAGTVALDRDEFLMLSEGSVFVPRDAAGKPIRASVDVVETPSGNREMVRVNWLTGRAEVLKAELP